MRLDAPIVVERTPAFLLPLPGRRNPQHETWTCCDEWWRRFEVFGRLLRRTQPRASLNIMENHAKVDKKADGRQGRVSKSYPSGFATNCTFNRSQPFDKKANRMRMNLVVLRARLMALRYSCHQAFALNVWQLVLVTYFSKRVTFLAQNPGQVSSLQSKSPPK